MARRAIAIRKARHLLDKLDVDDAPVDVQEIAEALGLQVQYQPFKADDDDVSGCIVESNGRFVIGINAAHHSNRQRFTIAHELGHFLLHRATLSKVHLQRDYKSSEGIEAQEIEANAFAAELLMPEALVRERLGDEILDAENDEQAIRDLAREFKVSAQAMTVRLVNLGCLARY